MSIMEAFDNHWSDDIIDGDDKLFIDKAYNRPYMANSVFEPGSVGYAKDLELEMNSIRNSPDLIFGDPVAHPFEYVGWGSAMEMANAFVKTINTDNTKDKIDTNKLFQREITNIQTIQAEQQKINKLFENKLMEQLKDKGQFGVNEDLTAGFQAYTAGKTAALNAAKELVAIRKTMAEISIKQNQAESRANAANNTNAQTNNGFNSTSSSTILDRIFDLPANPTMSSPFNAPEMNIEEAGSFFDSKAEESGIDDSSVSSLKYESAGAKTYVQVDAGGTNPRYVTLDSNGNEIPSYPNPIAEIKSVDVQSGMATNSLLETFDIIQR